MVASAGAPRAGGHVVFMICPRAVAMGAENATLDELLHHSPRVYLLKSDVHIYERVGQLAVDCRMPVELEGAAIELNVPRERTRGWES